MDLLDDDTISEPSAVKAPTRPKFQPKGKPQSKKGPSASVSVVTTATKEQQSVTPVIVASENSQLVQPYDLVEENIDASNSSSFAGIAKSKHASFSKESSNLNAGSSSGLNSPENVVGQSAIAAHLSADTSTLDASTTQVEEEVSNLPDVAFASASPFRPCSAHKAQNLSMHSTNQDLEQCKEALASKREDFQIDLEQGAEEFSDRAATDITDEVATASGPASPSIEANDNGYEIPDGVNDGSHHNSGSLAGAPDETPTNDNECNNDDYSGEETMKKKRPRKSKKVVCENDKPARKRRKEAKASDEPIKKPPKKFPHATRRKRILDKSLLEASLDNMNLQHLPIRDLILLAEYKERQEKKSAAVVQPPSTNERTDNTFYEDPPYVDDDRYGSDQDTGSLDIPSTSRDVKDTTYFNYATYTKKKQVRWSKQDTELFYQGVRQFGSDLSMITQLFPGREREHIKLKFKKEERQHPMRIHDALTSRAKDHSHFERVIQRLQERAAEEAANRGMPGEDDFFDPTGEEEVPDEGTLETDEAAKTEQNKEGSAGNEEPEKPEVASPFKSYDVEDDGFDWNYHAD